MARYTVIEVEHQNDETDLIDTILELPHVTGVVELEYDGQGGYQPLEETRREKEPKKKRQGFFRGGLPKNEPFTIGE